MESEYISLLGYIPSPVSSPIVRTRILVSSMSGAELSLLLPVGGCVLISWAVTVQ